MPTTIVKFGSIKVGESFTYDNAKWKRLSDQVGDSGTHGVAWEYRDGQPYKEWGIGLNEEVSIAVN